MTSEPARPDPLTDVDVAEAERWARTALRLGPDAAIGEIDADGAGITVRVRAPFRARARVSLVIEPPSREAPGHA